MTYFILSQVPQETDSETEITICRDWMNISVIGTSTDPVRCTIFLKSRPLYLTPKGGCGSELSQGRRPPGAQQHSSAGAIAREGEGCDQSRTASMA